MYKNMLRPRCRRAECGNLRRSLPFIFMLGAELLVLTSSHYPEISEIGLLENDARPVWGARNAFLKLGYEELPCGSGDHVARNYDFVDDGTVRLRPAECCACRSFIDHYEWMLNRIQADLPPAVKHDLQTTWRMESRIDSNGVKQKKRADHEEDPNDPSSVPFARHMNFILHYFDRACYNVSLSIPAEETRIEEVQFVVESVCNEFFEIFEDDIGRAMYNNFSRQADYLCGDEVTGACSDFYYAEEFEEVLIEVEE